MRQFADRTSTEWTTFDSSGTAIRTGEKAKEDRFLACGMRSCRNDKSVSFTLSPDGRAGLGGVQYCASVWVCAECAAKIQANRAEDLGNAAAWVRRNMKTLGMFTFTVRHTRKDALVDVWDAVADGWASVTSGSQWNSEPEDKFAERVDRWESAVMSAHAGFGRMPRGGHAGIRPERRVGDQERYGVIGWARAAEVTVGANGWHVHLHVIVALDGDRDAAAANAEIVAERMWGRWMTGIGKTGFTALKDHGGLNVRVTKGAEKAFAEYLQKLKLGDDYAADRAKLREGVEAAGRKAAKETVLGANKNAARGGQSPFELLDSIDFSGNKVHAKTQFARWREFVEGSLGRRQLTWSAGFRELVGLPDEEETDKEIMDKKEAGAEVLVAPCETWLKLRFQSMDARIILEDRGVAGLKTWLDDQGLEWEEPPVEEVEDDPEDETPVQRMDYDLQYEIKLTKIRHGV